mmetsp:Transcript_64510/g.129731  ORF Transcript_64510/g.129731 Transcript_64510/m.129731 type:complete len:96 (-) Transcript_64510:856-1143(-)
MELPAIGDPPPSAGALVVPLRACHTKAARSTPETFPPRECPFIQRESKKKKFAYSKRPLISFARLSALLLCCAVCDEDRGAASSSSSIVIGSLRG